MAKKKDFKSTLIENTENVEDIDDVELGKRVFSQIMLEENSKNRYKAFKEAKIDARKLEKFILNKYDETVSDVSSVVLATLLKIYCGELVEEARELQTSIKMGGPIQKEFLKIASLKVKARFQGDLFKRIN